MKSLFAALVVTACLFATTANARCFYIADAPLDAPEVRAAADLAFPLAQPETPSQDTEAARAVFERLLDGRISAMAHVWSIDDGATPPDRRYVAVNGVAFQLKTRNCDRGLDDVRRYLAGIRETSTNDAVASTLSLFSDNAREVTEQQYLNARPARP